jgi:hypothetical protein
MGHGLNGLDTDFMGCQYKFVSNPSNLCAIENYLYQEKT